jgi:hypothetical protein
VQGVRPCGSYAPRCTAAHGGRRRGAGATAGEAGHDGEAFEVRADEARISVCTWPQHKSRQCAETSALSVSSRPMFRATQIDGGRRGEGQGCTRKHQEKRRERRDPACSVRVAQGANQRAITRADCAAIGTSTTRTEAGSDTAAPVASLQTM